MAVSRGTPTSPIQPLPPYRPQFLLERRVLAVTEIRAKVSWVSGN